MTKQGIVLTAMLHEAAHIVYSYEAGNIDAAIAQTDLRAAFDDMSSAWRDFKDMLKAEK